MSQRGRDPRRPDPGRPTASSRPADSKEGLLEAARAAVQEVKRKEAAKARPSRHSSRVVLLVTAGALLALAIYLMAVRPAWFFTPPAPPDPVEIQDASLRLMLVREAARIRQFQRATGRLPATLAEAGAPVTGVEYLPAEDGTFVLRTALDARVLELRSSDSVAGFLGNSFQIISDRVRR